MNHYIKIIPVAFLLSLSTAYCYSQQSASNWKTYTNSKYGFSFQYPGTWTIAGDSDITVAGKIASRSIRFIDPVLKTTLLISYTLAKGAEIYNFYNVNFDPLHNKRITVDGDGAIEITTMDKRNGKGRLLNKKDQEKEINVEFLDKNKTGEFELKFRTHLDSNLAEETKKFTHLVQSFKRLR